MTYKENIRAILECHFTGFKEDIIDSACNRILEQEPILDKISAEIEDLYSYADFDEDTKTCYNMVRLEEVQRVIDKYRGESEAEEC